MRYNREKKELTFDEAKDKALRLLEFRSHSERELSDKLMRTKKICFCLLLKKGLKVTLKRKTLINVYDILCTEVTAFLTLKIV